MCSFMSFDKCIHSYNHTQINICNISITTESFLVPFPSQYPQQEASYSEFCRLILPVLELHVNRIIQLSTLLCLDSFAPHSILRLIHVVVRISSLFLFFFYCWVAFHSMNVPLCWWWTSGLFPTWAVVNTKNAALNIHLCLFVHISFHCSWENT